MTQTSYMLTSLFVSLKLVCDLIYQLSHMVNNSIRLITYYDRKISKQLTSDSYTCTMFWYLLKLNIYVEGFFLWGTQYT